MRTNLGEDENTRVSPEEVTLHEEVGNIVFSLAPQTFFQVHTAQAKAMVNKGGYRIVSIHPIDMFPQTPHIESVVLLQNLCKK